MEAHESGTSQAWIGKEERDMTKIDNPMLDQIQEGRFRGSQESAKEPRAIDARYDEAGYVLLTLANRALVGFPTEIVPELAAADSADLANVKVNPGGITIGWPTLDFDLSVPGFMYDLLRVPEWHSSFIGQRKSAAKAKAARQNGLRGGRPSKAVEPTASGYSKPRARPARDESRSGISTERKKIRASGAGDASKTLDGEIGSSHGKGARQPRSGLVGGTSKRNK
jgi:hypothetical protein